MSEDVYEPLDRFRVEFREKFARLTSAMFASLVRASGVDEKRNAKTVAKISLLEGQLHAAQSRRQLWQFLFVVVALGIILSVLGFVFALLKGLGLPEGASPLFLLGLFAGLVGAAVSAVLLVKVVVPNYRRVTAAAQALSGQIELQKAQAWAQMAPLNQLYDWDMSAKLIAQTVPRIQFDPYFTAQRLQELQQGFGFDGNTHDGQSVLFAQSGVINGNPFVFGHVRKMSWGEKTYTGRQEISWTVRVRGKDGKYYSVRRHQTLVASVNKPIPVYSEEKFLLYGNDAAPGLTFSRTPSALSDDDDGIIHTLHKKYVLGKLKDFSRNLEDESQYTLMANHDFEALFHATDRNDEVEFRLLFTPLAQQQMLKLLRDKEIGFGDDFAFVKQGRLNVLWPKHLHHITFDTDPRQFAHYHLNRARAFFQRIHEEYFKAVYFALAPLLAIPLYQQTRTCGAIHAGPGDRLASFWEHESLANYHGEKLFQHPQCITGNILKTRRVNETGGASAIAVIAHGYKGRARTEYQNIRGGDGRVHRVGVKWIEYLPVQQTRTMLVAEQPGCTLPEYRRRADDIPAEWQRLLHSSHARWEHAIFRRSILSFLEKAV